MVYLSHLKTLQQKWPREKKKKNKDRTLSLFLSTPTKKWGRDEEEDEGLFKHCQKSASKIDLAALGIWLWILSFVLHRTLVWGIGPRLKAVQFGVLKYSTVSLDWECHRCMCSNTQQWASLAEGLWAQFTTPAYKHSPGFGFHRGQIWKNLQLVDHHRQLWNELSFCCPELTLTLSQVSVNVAQPLRCTRKINCCLP